MVSAIRRFFVHQHPLSSFTYMLSQCWLNCHLCPFKCINLSYNIISPQIPFLSPFFISYLFYYLNDDYHDNYCILCDMQYVMVSYWDNTSGFTSRPDVRLFVDPLVFCFWNLWFAEGIQVFFCFFFKLCKLPRVIWESSGPPDLTN